MATTAKEIIEQARDYHTLFNYRNVPELGALKAVGRLESQLAGAVVMENPEALAQWYEVDVLPEDWEDGIELPENLIVLGADVIYEDREPRRMEVSIVSPDQSLTQPHLYPSVYVMGDRLHLTDLRQWYGRQHGWEELVSLRIRYVPSVADLESAEQNITLPDTAVSALVTNLAVWMADRTGANLATLRSAAEASGAGWVQQMINLASTRSWMVEVVD